MATTTEDRVNVEITGTLDGLTATTTQAQAEVKRASASMKQEAEGMAGAFEGMAHRFEHSGVMVAFAISNLANDSEKGVSRALHSIAMLGFAFGPVVGAVTTAVAIILEKIEEMIHESEKKAKEFAKTLESAVKQGQADVLAQQQLVTMVELAEATAKFRKVQGTLLEAFYPSEAKHQLAELRDQYEQITKAIEKAAHRAEILAQSGTLTPAKITVDSPEKAAREAKEAMLKKLAATEAAMKLEQFLHDELEKAIVDGERNMAKEQEKRTQISKEAGEEAQKIAKQAVLDMKIQREGAEGLAKFMQDANDKWTDDLWKKYEKTADAIIAKTGSIIENFVVGTENIGQAWGRMLRETLSAALHNIEKTLAMWIIAEMIKKKVGDANRKDSVLNDAKKAAAATYASVSEIPIVGPFLAPPAAAAAFAAVAAFGAEGGFDVPAGLNPVTQLHQREMVLPADLADKIRNGGGVGGGMVVHIHAIDAASFRDFADQHADTFHDAVMSAASTGRGKR